METSWQSDPLKPYLTIGFPGAKNNEFKRENFANCLSSNLFAKFINNQIKPSV